MNVILIGYRGTGKTSVGRLLAAKLGRPFLDSDELVKVSSGKTVREMVAEKGWGFFARKRSGLWPNSPQMTIASSPSAGARFWMKRMFGISNPKGFLIWLTAEAQTIVDRLNGDGKSFEQRPPLAGKDPDEETRSLLKAREPLYAKIADCRVDTSDRSIEEMAAEVLRILGERPERNPDKGKQRGG